MSVLPGLVCLPYYGSGIRHELRRLCECGCKLYANHYPWFLTLAVTVVLVVPVVVLLAMGGVFEGGDGDAQYNNGAMNGTSRF